MANSSSDDLDDLIHDIGYQSISVIDGNSCKNGDIYAKCPLCKRLGKSFYCVECIRNGNFMHSKQKCFERFADKKLTKYKLDAEKTVILQKYEDIFSKRKEIENVKLEIYKCKEKIQLLKASIQSSRATISKDEKLLDELKEKNSQSLSSQLHFNEKLFEMRRCQKLKRMELTSICNKLESLNSDLQNLVSQRTNELVTHIFPIARVPCQFYKDGSYDEGCLFELEEAQKTTYIQGQWVIASSAVDDIQYSIVKPCIPSSGDYSAYITWCAGHIQGISRDSLSTADRCQFDKAYGISAALAYVAQLVSILSFYMDTHLPKKCSFSDFCGHETSKAKFLHKVAKLNSNIVHLCLAREVDISEIIPHHTIPNLLLLLKTRKGVTTSQVFGSEDENFMESIKDYLSKDLLSVDESDSDDTEAEFVHLSDEEEYMSIPDPSSIEPVTEQHSLVASVFSLFKAATG